MNIRDTEIMAQTLSEGGYIESGSIDDASLVILNTCSIRAKAEQKVFSLLGSLRKKKALNPDLPLPRPVRHLDPVPVYCRFFETIKRQKT